LNTQHHILIVEDEKAIRESLQDMLEINGYVVAIAENGLEGLKSIQESNKFF
jgi:CheY-like chemotaxis protein|tara:strand:+ start:18719 stop:18874 length:156 start_codon:yes stop_codon:yes gene_type:complete